MKRGLLRWWIDFLAIVSGGTVVYVATESFIWMIVGQITVAAYGMWCFADGKMGA